MTSDSVYSRLIETIDQLKPKKILLVAFEDSQAIRILTESFKGKIRILTKSDFVSSGLFSISKKVRDSSYDLAVISNLNSQLNRNRTSLKLLALLTRSKRQIILFDESEISKKSKFTLLLDLIPNLFTGILISIYVLLKAFFYFYLIYPLFWKKIKIANAEKKSILFLRTDLAGKVVAGGSVTHIKGFLNGSKQLGLNAIYVADYPLIDFDFSIVLKPNRYLEFFDEFQLIGYHFKLIRYLKKFFDKNSIGLIYQRHSIFNASGVILSKKLNIPVILEVNNSEVWAKKNWSRLVFEKLATKIEKFALRNADLLSVVSDVTREQIKKYEIDESKIIVNPNGVDPEKFSPSIDGSRLRKKFNLDENFVVGFIGTFTRWHGVETLFEAAIKVHQLNPEIKFLLIGDGNLKPELELKTYQLNLNDEIKFTGIIPHSEAPDYLAACDVLVSPHLGFDSGERFFGSPTKLFEYMAMGKPIIASDLEQIGKIIIDEFNGLKFQPGNSDELASKIIRLYNEKELRLKLGSKARETVLQNYTWKHNAFRVLSRFFELDPK